MFEVDSLKRLLPFRLELVLVVQSLLSKLVHVRKLIFQALAASVSAFEELGQSPGFINISLFNAKKKSRPRLCAFRPFLSGEIVTPLPCNLASSRCSDFGSCLPTTLTCPPCSTLCVNTVSDRLNRGRKHTCSILARIKEGVSHDSDEHWYNSDERWLQIKAEISEQ